MIRNIAISSLIFLSFLSCRQKQEGNLKIQVNLKNNPVEQTVYLVSQQDGAPRVVLDTLNIGPGDRQFRFSTNADHVGLFQIRFSYQGNFIWFTNDKHDINIDVDWNDFGAYTVFSPGSASLKNLARTFNERLLAIDSVKQKAYGLKGQDSLLKAVTTAYTNQVNEAVSYVLHYADTTSSAGVAIYALGIIKEKQPDTSQLVPVMSRLASRFASNREVTKICNEYFDYLNKIRASNLVGIQAPAFSMADTSGKQVSLQSFNGKYLFLDFWASWCEPCRRANPELVKLYDKYRDRNFTILGVSLDKEKSEWIKAIHDDHLNWNHVSDLLEWHSAAVNIFRIEGIPSNLLIDPKGKIIAQNLSSRILDEKLSGLLK